MRRKNLRFGIEFCLAVSFMLLHADAGFAAPGAKANPQPAPPNRFIVHALPSSGPALSAEQQRMLDSHCTEAMKAMTMDNYQKAILECDAAIAISPNVAVAYDLRGGAQMAIMNTDLAIQDINRALALDWRIADRATYSNLATAYSMEDRLPQALKAIDAGLKRFPSSDNLYRSKAKILTRSKFYDEAVIAFDSAIKLQKPNEPLNFQGRGDVYRLKKDYAKAIPDFTAAIAALGRSPNDTEHQMYKSKCLASRAECYEKLGKTALAAKDRQGTNDFSLDLIDPSFFAGEKKPH